MLIVIALALGIYGDGGGREQLHARIARAPHDVAGFIERRVACNHFDGEVGSGDAERALQIERARGELRCNNLEKDAARLGRKYSRHSEVLRLLRDTADLLPPI